MTESFMGRKVTRNSPAKILSEAVTKEASPVGMFEKMGEAIEKAKSYVSPKKQKEETPFRKEELRKHQKREKSRGEY